MAVTTVDTAASSPPSERRPADLIRACKDCPFARGAAVRLTVAQAEAVLERLFSPQGGFACHATAEVAADGTLTGDRASACAGAQIFIENCAQSHPALALLASRIQRPEGANPAHLRGRERIFDTIAEFISSALPDGAPRHRAYLRPAAGGPLVSLETE